VEREQDMLALDVQTGDIAIRTDMSVTYILAGQPADDLQNWVKIETSDGVTSFNGRAGAIRPERGDYDTELVDHDGERLSAYLDDEKQALNEHIDNYDNPHGVTAEDRKSTRLNSSHVSISYAVFCLKKQKQNRS